MNRLNIAALAVLATAATLLPLEAPLRAEPTASDRDRIAELCTASNADLIGKRLARECRQQLRAAAELHDRVSAVRVSRRVAERVR